MAQHGGQAALLDDGARSERNRMARLLHDTVLQCLEAMALSSGTDQVDPAGALAELRAAARAEALRLRQALHDPADGTDLTAGLVEVVGEATARGLRVLLVTAERGGRSVTPRRTAALCGGTREALRNVSRHAGAAEAVVRVEDIHSAVRVTVRDHGRGFAVEESTLGFGIRESIVGRLVEVGGRARIESTPASGTRVTLWVPA
jgi:signal transduction histidine kinase